LNFLGKVRGICGYGVQFEKERHCEMMRWAKMAITISTLTALIFAFGIYRLRLLNATPIASANFSWVNKIEIYILGIAMAGIAYPFYPEVAREHLMLYSSSRDDPTVIRGDFFISSEIVQDAIKRTERLKRPYRLVWPVSSYQFSLDSKKYSEARIALALNGGFLRIENGNAIVKVKIAYPKKSFTPLFSIPLVGVIGVEEGLFWVLQQDGWLQTRYVEWVAPIKH